jgi:2-methylcitrate synthase
MSEPNPPSSSSGLRGQSAGSTAICTVGKSGVGLTYRRYPIEELAEHATFEEVAFLLLEGILPNQQQLAGFKKRLRALRFLPPALKEVLERIPKSAHPMDVLRTGASMAGVLEPEGNFSRQDSIAERLLASLPSILSGIASVMTEALASNWIRMKRPWPVIFSRCSMMRNRVLSISVVWMFR